MSEEESERPRFCDGECWAAGCTEPPDGYILSGEYMRVAVCEGHGEEYVERGNWDRFEDVRGWVDREDNEL